MFFFTLVALVLVLVPSLPLIAALPIPPSSLTQFDPLGEGVFLPDGDVDQAFEMRQLKQATREEVVARLLADTDMTDSPQASPSARAVAPRASPSPNVQLSANVKRSTPEVVLVAPECEKALSVVDFAVVCAPITVLDPASAAAFLQSGGLVKYKDGTVYTDPLYSSSSGDENSPLRALINAYSALQPKGTERRALPFFTRWAMREERNGSLLLALSPNTAIRISDLKDIGLNLLSQAEFDHVKVAGITFDWRTMQAIVDNITF
ncbi:hypothetical protein CALVIDRAFT_538729 [Calocera viscosa TUFC12733]|uniref:Uncharacterized protein n=1 Tax=Calocera viscosa (strain TUFC12733) TaxID=1330018 RepID=A0A167KFZ6_CALVF|nr:hypothetical protein CALVIDRAFT_538729 [Calocera viscosa TUFC12733]